MSEHKNEHLHYYELHRKIRQLMLKPALDVPSQQAILTQLNDPSINVQLETCYNKRHAIIKKLEQSLNVEIKTEIESFRILKEDSFIIATKIKMVYTQWENLRNENDSYLKSPEIVIELDSLKNKIYTSVEALITKMYRVITTISNAFDNEVKQLSINFKKLSPTYLPSRIDFYNKALTDFEKILDYISQDVGKLLLFNETSTFYGDLETKVMLHKVFCLSPIKQDLVAIMDQFLKNYAENNISLDKPKTNPSEINISSAMFYSKGPTTKQKTIDDPTSNKGNSPGL